MAFFTAFFRQLTDEQKVAAPFIIEKQMEMQHTKSVREQKQKDIAEGLGLSADQKNQIEKIKSEYEPKIEKQLADLQQQFKNGRNRLVKVLNVEQLTKFEELCKGKARG
jgi:predicted  nucleic acid-binding Zn-ribbon protein